LGLKLGKVSGTTNRVLGPMEDCQRGRSQPQMWNAGLKVKKAVRSGRCVCGRHGAEPGGEYIRGAGRKDCIRARGKWEESSANYHSEDGLWELTRELGFVGTRDSRRDFNHSPKL